MKLRILETYNASSSFRTENNPDRIASNWIGPTKVGKVSINDYMRYEKGQDAKIVYMSPNEYLERCAKDIFNSTWEKTVASIEKNYADTITKYANDMKNGDKFPIPYLDYVYQNQEGRHRALAVKQAFGEDSIMPVLVIIPTNPTKEELMNYCNRKFPNNSNSANMFYDSLCYKYFPEEIEEDNTEEEMELDSDTDFEFDNTDFNIDDELDNLFDDLDEEDFVKFVNQKYGKNFTSIVEIDNTLFSKALDDYYDI